MTKFESLPEPCPDARLAPATSGVEPSALADLLKRVEAASGASRELDADLFRAFGNPPKVGPTGPGGRPKNYLDWRYDGAGVWRRSEFNQPAPDQIVRAPEYTASLDAALALAGQVLPHHRWELFALIRDETGWGAHSREPETETAYAPTPALALLSAMLRAIADRRC